VQAKARCFRHLGKAVIVFSGRELLTSPRFKHLARRVLSLRSLMSLKKAIGAKDQQSTY